MAAVLSASDEETDLLEASERRYVEMDQAINHGHFAKAMRMACT